MERVHWQAGSRNPAPARTVSNLDRSVKQGIVSAMELHPAIRLLGQKVAGIERNWPHRVKNRVFDLAPTPSGAHPRKMVVLCEPRTFADGCWSAWSWMRWVRAEFGLRLYVDGPVTAGQRLRFAALFPGAEIESLPDFLVAQPEPGPALARFKEHYTYARKLSLLLALQREGDFLYSDADVAVFRRPDLIMETVRLPSVPGLYMQEPGCYCVDPWMAESAARLGLPRENDLNSGLLLVRRDSLDTALAERLLVDWQPAFFHRVAEQTLLSVLMAVNGAKALPPEQYVVSNDGMFFWQGDDIDYERIVARHFMGNVRHLLYLTAWPRLLAMNRREVRNLH